MKKYVHLFLFFLMLLLKIHNANAKTNIHGKVTDLLLKNNFIEAEKIAKEAYEKAPNDAESICALACVYRNKAHREIIKIDTSAMGIKEGENGKFILTEKNDINKYFKSGYYYDREQYKKAEKLYYEIIEKLPNYVIAYFNLLNDYVEMEEFDKYFKVIDVFIRNLKTSEETSHSLIDLGNKLIKKEFYNQAEKLYLLILQNYPNLTYLKSDIGVIYLKRGNIEKAVGYFKEVYKEKPDDEININNLISGAIFIEDFPLAYEVATSSREKSLFKLILLHLILDKNHQKECEDFLKNRVKNVQNIEDDFWYQSAQELKTIKQKSQKEQIEYFENLMYQFNEAKYDEFTILLGNLIEKLGSTNFSLLTTASVFDRNNFYKKTLKWLDKIKKRKQIDDKIISNYQLNFNYGRAYFVGNQYDEALRYFKMNENQKENDVQNNYMIGMCYLNLADKEKAKKYFSLNKALNIKEEMEYINYSIQQLKRMNSH